MNDMTRPAGSFAIRHTNSGVDEFLRRADEQYETQRKTVLDKEAVYLAKRQEMSNTYGRKMSDLAAEGADALRKFDRQHQAEMVEENEKLATLARMRDG